MKKEVIEITVGKDGLGRCKYQKLFDGKYYVLFYRVDEDGREILTMCKNERGEDVSEDGLIVPDEEMVYRAIERLKEKVAVLEAQKEAEAEEQRILTPKGYLGFGRWNKNEHSKKGKKTG